MSKLNIAIISGLSALLLIGIFSAIYIRQNSDQYLTFAACTEQGGTAWQVDLYHPEICLSCAVFSSCESGYNNFSKECPQCYGACQECQDQHTLHESCPECYGPCQTCENKYLNEFESEEQRLALCPECKKCNACRDALEIKRASCPACLSCSECRNDNKRDIEIGVACPQITPCTECMNDNSPYPDKCPGGQEVIGRISDAATWFLCCKE